MSVAPLPDQPETLRYALGYIRKGWRVIPIPSGQKHPAILAWQTEGSTDEGKIRHWWTAQPDLGIGILTGIGSQLVVLDVDEHGAIRGGETLAALETTYGKLPDTVVVMTGGGGFHYYFRWPEGRTIRNDAGQRLGPGLDIRGEGGQVIAPPSLHSSGRHYEFEASSTPKLVKVAEMPAWLVDLLDPLEPVQPQHRPTPAAGDRPGDLWAADNTWADLLTGDGWTLHHVDRAGEEHWTRPGKERREGTSATVGYMGSDVLKVFTSSHADLGEGKTYSKLGYYAATRYGGDHSATASALRAAGYYVDRDDDLAFLIGGQPSADDPWPEPQPIPTVPLPPAFPLGSLPDWARDHAEAVAEQIQVPVDLAAMLIIGALSAACTGRAEVHVSANWIEPVNLYLATALRSGAGKSPTDKLTVAWLRTWQRERIEQARVLWEQARLKLRRAEKALADAERKGSEADAFQALAARDTARDAVPILPRLVADDATPEAVAGLLAAHGERLAILSTEADLFDMLLNGKKGSRASLNIYLKAWAGDAFTRDRKGGSESGPEYADLKGPLLTVSITVQPSVLATVNGDDELVNRGFAARFMYSLPTDMIGRRDHSRRFGTERLTTAAPFEARCRGLADQWASWQNPATLRFSHEAGALLLGFLAEIEPQLAGGAELYDLAEWANKLHGSIARYAGLLHLTEHSAQEPISVDTAARAVDLGRYWLAHARAVLKIDGDPEMDDAMSVLEWMARSEQAEFTIRDLQKGIRSGRFRDVKAVDFIAPIRTLIEFGWVRPVDNRNWASRVGVKNTPSPNFSLWSGAVGKPQRARLVPLVPCPPMGESNSLFSPMETRGHPHTPTSGDTGTRGTRAADSRPPVDNSDLEF